MVEDVFDVDGKGHVVRMLGGAAAHHAHGPATAGRASTTRDRHQDRHHQDRRRQGPRPPPDMPITPAEGMPPCCWFV